MTRSIKLVGLDCGSTTTSVVVAAARLTTGALGRVEITDLSQVFRSEAVFTPLVDERIDAARLARYLDQWLAAAQTRPEEIFGGGALITGLAAQRENAQAVAALIESRLADAIIATADNPRLESWLAFMGNCHALSQAHPETPLLNLDIGGGTTNLAVGLDGQVLATGCLFVGARHFQFEPGSYRLTCLSKYATALVEYLQLEARAGDTLSPSAIDTIVGCYVAQLERAVDDNRQVPTSAVGRLHVQAPLHMPTSIESAAITLSGGVGQLVYQQLQDSANQNKNVTEFGDLGVELAQGIARSPILAGRLSPWLPPGLGRATVYGLLQHSTELSGSTIYLPHPERLPLANVPIVGRIDPSSSDEHLSQSLGLASASTPAVCLQVELEQQSGAALQDLGSRLAALLAAHPLPPGQTLVLLVPANLGKVLGNYITRWGTQKVDLIVADEVPLRDAQFVRLGRPRDGVVPLWLYAAR